MFELLHSASDAFLGLFEPRQQQASVDSPQWNSLGSPRDTVMTFVEAMNHVAQGRSEAMPRALKTFGDGVPPAQSEQAASDLLEVFDRLPKINPGDLPTEQMVRQRDIRRFELFPRGVKHEWLYKTLDGAPEGSIVLTKQPDNDWEFTQATIENAGSLRDSLMKISPRPRVEHQGELFLSVIEPTFTKTTPLNWCWFLGWTAAGMAIAWGISRSIRAFRQARKDRREDFLTPMVDGLQGPLAILSLTLGGAIGTTHLYLHPVLSELRWHLIEAAVVLAGVWLLVAVIDLTCLGVRRTFFPNDDPYARMMSLVIRRSLRAFAGVVLLLFVLQNIFQWNVAAMIGGVGILALALSLAAQDAVKNLFGALTVFATRPFLRGDWIHFAGEIGQVEDVSLQATRMRLLSGEVLSVPNMKFIDQAVENFSMRKYLRRVMNIQITYDTPADKVSQAIEMVQEILQSDDLVGDGQQDLETYPPRVWFDQFGSHYLNLRVDYWYLMDPSGARLQRDAERGWFSYLDHATQVNQAILQRFNDAGIDFAFPTQSLYLADDPQRKLTVETHQAESIGA